SVSGSAYGGMGRNADPNGFWKQWAFTQVELNPPGGREDTGKGVRVGVFDTSPYSATIGDSSTPFTNTHISPELTLNVHTYIELPILQATVPITDDVKDHGLFVSSLVHAFAPQSQIHLYRVLDDSGCGDLYRLNAAMLNFLSRDWSKASLIQPAVINLSLGVRKPRESRSELQEFYSSSEGIENMDDAIQHAMTQAKRDPSIESLGTTVQLAYQAGMVIVAAGGNNSVITTPTQPNMPLPMDLPADYKIVIGASASTDTNNNGPACYSNRGDVAAPGGEAKQGINSSTGNPICVSKASDCPTIAAGNPGSCEYGVIGLSTVSTRTHYAYWVGTSFAAPMASGLAALVYKEVGNPGDTWTRVTTNVNTSIPNHDYGSGLINVNAALGP
ncbi:MAG: S8 family serine peptidase, partial [Anaerolineales bacterium]